MKLIINNKKELIQMLINFISIFISLLFIIINILKAHPPFLRKFNLFQIN